MSNRPRQHWIRVLSAIAPLVLAVPETALGQVAGQSVNMVSGTDWPGGDPFRQRQNEPSIAMSSRNQRHLLAGANDYRTVDVPFSTPNSPETGDAWLGVFKSFDGGITWYASPVEFPTNTAASAGYRSRVVAAMAPGSFMASNGLWVRPSETFGTGPRL